MQYYEQLLANLQVESPQQAELMEEEINIMIHKLKFLPSENFPTVSILQQESDFAPIYSDELHNKIKIAGANLILEHKS
jgi:iron complex transport system substrate-binding protein